MRTIVAITCNVCGDAEWSLTACLQIAAHANELIQRQGAALTAAAGPTAQDSALGRQALYVKGRLILDRLGALDGGAGAPPASLLFPDTAGSLRKQRASRAYWQRTVRALEGELFGGTAQRYDSPACRAGFADWLAVELDQWGIRLASKVAALRYADQLISMLSQRPKEKKQTMSKKHVLREAIAAGLKLLQEWAQWSMEDAARTGLAHSLPSATTELLTRVCATTIQDMIAGNGPWEAPALAPALKHAQEVWLRRQEVARRREETALLDCDCASLLEYLQHKLRVLQAAADAHPSSSNGRSGGVLYVLQLEVTRVEGLLQEATRVHQNGMGTELASLASELASGLFIRGDEDDDA